MESSRRLLHSVVKACFIGLTLWPATSCTAFAHRLLDMEHPVKAITVFGKAYNLSNYQTRRGNFTITAYNLDRQSTGKAPGDPGFGITATGRPAKSGETVAVDPHVVPYGSLLYIDGIGWRVAEDTGGAIRGHHIDLLVDSRNRAIVFGVKRNCKVEVYVPPKNRTSL